MKLLLTTLLILAFATTGGGCGEAKAPPAANATQAAAAAAPAAATGVPDFTVTTLEGKTLRLSDLRGQVVVVDYWATWCGPCRIAMPHLQKLHDTYKTQGVTVLALSVDQKGPSVVVPFIRQNGFTFAVAMADERSASAFGNFSSIPTTVIVRPDGRVHTTLTGVHPYEEYVAAVKAARAAAPGTRG
ncbi:MAG: TlpA family protein disulfide reductase [bacterium]|nr:TlpA family protein disulfide reductase [bacterium]